MRIYTRKGDDGTTGMLFGGRVKKSSTTMVVAGSLDEAQAMLGLARAEARRGSELDDLLVGLERDLYCAMAEIATAPANRSKLVGGSSLVTGVMVEHLEHLIDGFDDRFDMPTEFVLPGANRVSAALDVARTVVRRAEREYVGAVTSEIEGSEVGRYLNRLSDLLWTMARWQEGDDRLASRRSDEGE